LLNMKRQLNHSTRKNKMLFMKKLSHKLPTTSNKK
jgi:hypothetical protein